jgi:outer membrane protein, heavy metal efflux system
MNAIRGMRLLALLSLTGSLGAGALAAQGPPVDTTGPARGDTLVLTLGGAGRLASERNPGLLAARRAADAAAGRLRQARLYPYNPEVALRSVEMGGGRTFDAYEGEVSQEIEWAGQWGLRIDAARGEAKQQAFLTSDAERQIAAHAAVAFLEALAAQERLRLAEDIRTLNARLASAARDRLESGDISQMEMNLAQIEAGRAQTRVLAERRNAQTALLELRRSLALTEDRPLRLLADLPAPPDPEGLDADSLVQVALERRPDAVAMRAGLGAAEASARLAGRERWPNFRLSIPFERPDGARSRLVGLAVGLSVPLWNRNQGTLDETSAEVARSQAELDDVRLAVRTEVQDAYQRYVSASAEERLAGASVRDPARANQVLLEEAFRSGKIDLPTLLLIRNQLLDAELSYWDSWLQLRTELVRLDAATAKPTLDDEAGEV